MEDKYSFNLLDKRFEPKETRCWYCGVNNSKGNESNYFVKLFKEKERTNLLVYRSVTYNTFKIGIPRCTHCSKIHKQAKLKAGVIAVLAGILTFITSFYIWGIYGIFSILPALLIAAFGYIYLETKLMEKKSIVADIEGAKQDVTVEDYLMNGWTVAQPMA